MLNRRNFAAAAAALAVGLGAAHTIFSSIVQDYVRLKGLTPDTLPAGRMVAIVGDAELDEGNMYEALLEGWKKASSGRESIE